MSVPVKPGDVLGGKYRVERVIGAGGMGVVVAARHLGLDEPVAIKFLLPESLSEPSVVLRFTREGKAASKIRSEHVARVYDVGKLENGAPYIVMEFLEGSDLAEIVKSSGPLPEGTAVEYLLQGCEAIAEAHALGIIHRDIKPSNLFLASRRDGSPMVKVIDFGISKMDGEINRGMDLTKTTEARGSMLFMSPEHMTSLKSAGPEADIWSLGVSLHYLLTQSYPFSATTVPELCAMILQHEPTPLRAVRPDAPAGLEACILRCLRKNPRERFPSVGELAGALAEYAPESAMVSVDRVRRLSGLPVLERGQSSPLVQADATGLLIKGGTEPMAARPRAPPALTQPALEPAPADEGATSRTKTNPVAKPSSSTRLVGIGVALGAVVAFLCGSLVMQYRASRETASQDSVAPQRIPSATPDAAPEPSAAPVAVPEPRAAGSVAPLGTSPTEAVSRTTSDAAPSLSSVAPLSSASVQPRVGASLKGRFGATAPTRGVTVSPPLSASGSATAASSPPEKKPSKVIF